VQIDLTALPEEPAALQSIVREAVATTLQYDAQVNELTAENDKRRALLHRMLRHRFGRRSEHLAAAQLQLAIENLEQDAAEREAAENAAAASDEKRRQPRAVVINRQSLAKRYSFSRIMGMASCGS